MKGITVIVAALVLVFGTVASHAANVDTISVETGIPVGTLQAERASTGLGWGALEKANLIANASGQSFNMVVGEFQSGEGWGKIAHDSGLNLGQLVSAANRSSHATMHPHNTPMMHGKNNNMDHGMNGMNMGSSMSSMHAAGFSGTRGGMPPMSHMSGGRR